MKMTQESDCQEVESLGVCATSQPTGRTADLANLSKEVTT